MALMRMILAIIICNFLTIASVSALEVKMAVLRVDYPTLLPISRYDLKPEDIGFAGALLANEDNQTTGAFMGHEYSVETVAVAPDGAAAAMDALLAEGIRLFIVDANADDLLALSDQAGAEALVFNAGSRETRLRDADCRGNLLHVAPSHGIIADAAIQFAMWKKWDEFFLIHGSNPADQLLADAYRKAVLKFGGKIREEREYEDTGGSRRTDSGHVLVQRQMPVFTQDAKRHDVVIAADESDVFGYYLPFNLWDPRPVIGSAGLRPVTMHPAHEAWGATQFQRRFEKLAGRYVTETDHDTWLAVRVIGEGVIRTMSNDPVVLRDYILSDAFEIAAFKGQKLTFRDWNGQLRQPMILTDSKITISVSPQDGYLHRVSPLDTMGLDEPESTCTAFK